MYRLLSKRKARTLLVCLTTMSKLVLTAKFFFVVCVVGFAITVIWLNIVQQYAQYGNDTLIQEALDNAGLDPRYAEVYRRSDKQPNDTKYILLWTPADFAPFYYLGKGKKAFVDNNCSVIDCFVTDDRKFFGGDLTKFHAIAFNGRNILKFRASDLPRDRSPHQKYIFFNMESADNYPVCNDIFDDFFNWTVTYRLDSDIPYPYIKIRDKSGKAVGPKRHMNWEQNMTLVDRTLTDKLRNKSEAAAWFVSHCDSRSGRKEFVKQLQAALTPYGFNVDIYGSCGPLKCPITDKSKCNALLEEKYFFYLSLENSFAEDYVTEKLLTALQYNAVPVVYGGADYTRFLPPSSYLDGRALSPKDLAASMARLAWAPTLYRRFFAWRSYYTYHDPSARDDVCAVCEALNNRRLYGAPTVYRDFRRWWNPEFAERCQKKAP